MRHLPSLRAIQFRNYWNGETKTDFPLTNQKSGYWPGKFGGMVTCYLRHACTTIHKMGTDKDTLTIKAHVESWRNAF